MVRFKIDKIEGESHSVRERYKSIHLYKEKVPIKGYYIFLREYADCGHSRHNYFLLIHR